MFNKGVHLVSSEAMIDDLRAVHAELGYINQEAYRDRGRYAACTLRKRFGSWLQACAAAGLESRSHTGRNLVDIPTESRRCLGPGADHWFEAIKDDPSHRICDACKGRTAPDPWDRVEVADGWEVVGA